MGKKEGHNMLGAPTFEQLENGRFRCVQTGHEMTPQAKDSYAQSKHCRVGLIDAAVARGEPPLNVFNHDPASRMKLICKLTGATINKGEEHIWKHINGRRFLKALEKKEAERNLETGTNLGGKENKKKNKKKKKKKKGSENSLQKKNTNEKEKGAEDEIITEFRASTKERSDSESESDIWMPPTGERWDCDNGGDRWSRGSNSGLENDNVSEEDGGADFAEDEAQELSNQADPLSIEVEPTSFVSRKKKRKINGS